MSEEPSALKKRRSICKASVTKSFKTLQRLVRERNLDSIQKHGEKMKNLFVEFDDVSDAYTDTLCEDSEQHAASVYYDEVYDNYLSHLDTLNDSIDCLSLKDAAKYEQSNTSLSAVDALTAISQIINMPKMELETFDGTATTYQRFISIFKQVIEPSTPDQTVRLTRLLSHTTGDAHKAVSTIDPSTPNCYDLALDVLKKQFGSKYSVATTIMQNLRDGPSVSTPKQIRSLAYELKHAEITLKHHGMYAEINTQTCIVAVCKRLPRDLRDKWIDKTTCNQQDNDEYLPFSDFAKFIGNAADRLNDPVFGKEAFESNNPKLQSFAASSSMATQQRTSYPVCVACSKGHKLFYCETFRAMPLDDRQELVSKNHLCTLCLFPGHTVNTCTKPYLCTINNCKMKHCRYLHDTNVVQSSNVSVNFDIDVRSQNVMMPVVPIIINNTFHSYALLDTGSSHSFCSQRLVAALDIDGVETNYDLVTLNNTEKKNTIQVDLSIQPKDRCNYYKMSNVLVTENIPVQTKRVDLSKYDHLKGFNYPETAEVDVLIGQDHSELLFTYEYRRGKYGEPYAAKGHLGWSLHGSTASDKSSSKVVSHLISTGINLKQDRRYELDQDSLTYTATA